MTIGTRIAQYRKNALMTQEMLAQRLDVSNQAVSKWESDQCCPDIQLLPKLADIFGITIDALFGTETGKEPCAESASTALPWEDDKTLRVVMYMGHKLISSVQARGGFEMSYDDPVQNVVSAVSIRCGDVEGNVTAEGSVTCDVVGGNVEAGGSVTCDAVNGSIQAGGSVTCDDVGGDVKAGGRVTCDSVSGNVNAAGNVECDSVHGNISAIGSVTINI